MKKTKDEHNHSGKNCHKTLTQMSDYVDGELDLKSKKGLEKHFSNCKVCVAVMGTLRKTIEIFRSKPVEKMPKSVLRGIHVAIRDEMRGAGKTK